ncbi:MAG: GIY-YIG nuclease family protein [Phycisphaerae bacterium]|nr:GIY-YIG nuclease family protein [Phycisphaerae bacterium]
MWYVYILLCADDSFYVGHTQDIESREKRHNDRKGAVYTACRTPVRIVWQEKHESREMAMQREHQIKRWSKAKKKALIAGDLETLSKLAKRRI